MYFHTAEKYNLKIGFHIVKFRNIYQLKDQLIQLLNLFGTHPALYRIQKPGTEQTLPVVYIYDSYTVPTKLWQEILHPHKENSLRLTDSDAIFIGLVVDQTHLTQHILKGGFDGFYTYFVNPDMTWAAKYGNWDYLKRFADSYSLLWIASIGPGYIDTRVRLLFWVEFVPNRFHL